MSYKRNNFIPSGAAVSEQMVMNYVNDYFEMFEYNLKNCNHGAMNTQLPQLIVEKFKKLFELWDENRILGASMERKLFEEVFALMYYTFGDDSNDTRSVDSVIGFSLECNDCGEGFPLRNNDCRYSYEFHKTTPEHLEFTRYFNVQDTSSGNENGESGKNCIDFSVKPKRNDTSEVLPLPQPSSSSCDQPTKFMKVKPSQKCSNQGSSLKSKKNATVETVTNVLPVANSSSNRFFIREFDKHCIEVVNDVARCLLCNCKISNISNLVSHMDGSTHEKAVRRFVLNQGHFKTVGKSIVCNLCNANFPRICYFMEHCKKPDHQIKLGKLVDTSQPLKLTKNDLIDVETIKLQCPNCQKWICGVEEVLKHLKSGHKKNPSKNVKIEEKIKNDQSKKQIIPVAENSKKNAAAPLTTVSVMKFDTDYIAFLENTIQCGLCCCMIPSLSNFISHMNGLSHKAVVLKLGENAPHYKRINQYTWRCTLCIVNGPTLNEFLGHCKTKNHMTRLSKLLDKNLPTTGKPRGKDTLIDISKSRFKCPVCRCIVVGLEILYKHFHKTHPHVLQSNGLLTQVKT